MKKYIKSSWEDWYDYKYLVKGYYESIFRGLANSFETNDFSEAVDAAHEFCSQGDYIIVKNRETGEEFRCDPDTWMENIDLGGAPMEIYDIA